MLLAKIYGARRWSSTTFELTDLTSTKMCFKNALDGTYATLFDAALASFSNSRAFDHAASGQGVYKTH